MEEQFGLIKSYIAGVWLSKKYILILAWLMCPIGWLAVTMLPSQYTSKAVVYADTQSILKPLLRGVTIYTDPSQKLRLVANTLLNTKNLETIGNEVDLGIKAKDKAEYDAMLEELRSGIKINSTRRDNLYTISFTGAEPVYTRDVVQSALNVFIESIIGDKRTDTEEAQEVIDDQIEFYENRLLAAEKKLANFKREHLGLMPGSGNNYYSNLIQQQKALETDELALKETGSRIDEIKQQIRLLAASSASQLDSFETEYDARISAIEMRLDDLLFRFTERHPDVIESRRQLAEVSGLKKAYLKTLSQDKLLQENPIYNNLKINLNELNNYYASLLVRIDKHKTKIAELQSTLDYIPEVEAKLTSLNRDYSITKGKYDTLVARGETASISSNVDNASENIKFRIIESPNLPSSPSGPNRTLFYTFVLLSGLGAGISIAFLISLIKPVVSSIEQIQNSVGIPVLGVVSATKGSGYIQKARNANIAFGLLLAALLGLFASMVLYHQEIFDYLMAISEHFDIVSFLSFL